MILEVFSNLNDSMILRRWSEGVVGLPPRQLHASALVPCVLLSVGSDPSTSRVQVKTWLGWVAGTGTSPWVGEHRACGAGRTLLQKLGGQRRCQAALVRM